jgi:hypothetical protein
VACQFHYVTLHWQVKTLTDTVRVTALAAARRPGAAGPVGSTPPDTVTVAVTAGCRARGGPPAGRARGHCPQGPRLRGRPRWAAELLADSECQILSGIGEPDSESPGLVTVLAPRRCERRPRHNHGRFPAMPKKTSDGEDSEDIPLIGDSPARPRRSTTTSKPRYKIESSSDGDEESEGDNSDRESDGNSDDGSASEEKPKRKQRSKPKMPDDSDDDLDASNAEMSDDMSEDEKPRKSRKAQRPKARDSDDDVIQCTSPPKSKSRPEDGKTDFSDSDEEQRFLKLMEKFSPAKPKPKPSSAPVKSIAASSSPAKAKRADSVASRGDGEAAGDGENADSTAGARSSKIKFSRSVPLIVPGIKRVNRSTFIVQVTFICIS